MKLLFLLFIAYTIAEYNSELLNKFTADVDIYDIGRMGRGKNAASWNRNPTAKQEVFYYLAMQPWRHLVWTSYENNMWVKYFINEDASSIPDGSVKLSYTSTEQDYCRKEYATPMDKFDIDWTQIDSQHRLESADINGITCYKYPAKVPLANIYLQQHYTRERDVSTMTPCRYDFIGGKSITFRSFNTFSDVFITADEVNGYLGNKTKCKIDPTPNNVNTDLAIVLGISDSVVSNAINDALSALKSLSTLQEKKVYYMAGSSIKVEPLSDWNSLKLKTVTPGSVDAVINKAKNDLLKRVPSAVKRGTLVVLMDRPLSTSFDAETAFDRNNITVHTILYNPNNDNQMTLRARSLLSLGEYHHEFTSASQVQTVANELFVGVRANLTERCDRTKCNGFCDGRDRCTCPMCCENTCFFSYCDTTTASCVPWPPANPKPKITCPNDCVGERECRDMEGCVYTKYNPGCAPTAKCMRPYCEKEGKKEVCKQESACEQDKTPSYENKCWSYYCDEKSGNCVRGNHGNECPRLKSVCSELVCDADLTCRAQDKVCVKTSPYIEMDCYVARCNKKTGMCENALSCDKYTGCGTTVTDSSLCGCNPAGGAFTCTCKQDTTGYCEEGEVCDTIDKKPTCKKSNCSDDLYVEGCRIRRCNEDTGENYWEDKDCSKLVKFDFIEDAADYCTDKYEIVCDDGNCFGRMKQGTDPKAACGRCNLGDPTEKNGVKTYPVTYTENCKDLYPICENGKESTTASKYFPKGESGVCKKLESGEFKCVVVDDKLKTPNDVFDYCSGCYTNECNKAKGYVEYTFNATTGKCKQSFVNSKPSCSVCNENGDAFVEQCVDKKFGKVFTYKHGANKKDFNYEIPKTCANEQCIPVVDFDCMDTTRPDIKAIVDALSKCSNSIHADYIRSPKFDINLYYASRPQTDDYMKTAEQETYCYWNITMEQCHYCRIGEEDETFVDVNECEEKENELKDKIKEQVLKDQVDFVCEDNECKENHKFGCKTQHCWKFIPEYVNGNVKCVNTTETTCQDIINEINEALATYIPDEKVPEVKCFVDHICHYKEVKEGEEEPKDNNKCSITYSHQNCVEAFESYAAGTKDFGCRIPNLECDESTYHCTFRPLERPEDDTAYFRNRDSVILGNKCYNYTCVEEKHADGSFEHHWKMTEESIAATTAEPLHLCDEVYCEPSNGTVMHKEITCRPQDAFKMTDAQAQCFECKCSYIDGEPQIVMKSNTNEETFELDACGNCIVRNKAGEQTNEHVECILSATVNLTGAIAGATVAASVVFGLIGSMVVVSIGAFQTYQLVSSAMKNVIATTLENPEFVAADNEATNVLANGD